MTILEPMTMVTDYLLGSLAGVLGVLLWRLGRAGGNRTTQLWAGSFLTTAGAAIFGGTAHGFAAMLSPTASVVLWKLTVWSIGLTAFQVLAATATAVLTGTPRRVIIALAALHVALYALWMIWHDDFVWVIAGYLPAVLVALAAQSRSCLRGHAGAGWLVAGLLTTLAGAAVQAGGVAPHASFNHNDLYHVIQMGATVMLYRGAVQARDLSESKP